VWLQTFKDLRENFISEGVGKQAYSPMKKLYFNEKYQN